MKQPELGREILNSTGGASDLNLRSPVFPREPPEANSGKHFFLNL